MHRPVRTLRTFEAREARRQRNDFLSEERPLSLERVELGGGGSSRRRRGGPNTAPAARENGPQVRRLR